MSIMSIVHLNDIDLHYQCLGEGEPVVLIHGLAANLAFWYPGIASALAQNYQVIVFDLRGHGHSSMPSSGYSNHHLIEDVLGLLSHLRIEQFHLIGHSLGARISACLASTYPERVATLTLADTLFQCLQPGTMRLKDWHYWSTWKQEMAELGSVLPEDDAVMDFRLLLELDRIYNQLSRTGHPKVNKLSLKSRELGAKGRARWNQLLETTTIVAEFDQGERLSRTQLVSLSVPTCAIYGEHSHCLPTYWKLQEVIPDCRGVLISDAGHFHPAIKPADFIAAVRAFLQEHPLSVALPVSQGLHYE